MAKLGDLVVRIGADTRDLNKQLGRVQRNMRSMTGNLQNMGRTISQSVTLPLAGMAALSIQAFRDQAKAVAQVEQGLKSTGNAAGKTLQELTNMATDLQKKTLFGDEDILQNATAQLLTFTNIAGEQFDRTQKAALDLATRLGGDLKSASIQLGKALNDPIANLSALSRSGIQFSKEQKEVIKTLAETGQLAKAQGIILDELEKQYGGSAEAAAAADGGITQLQNAIGDLGEEVGKIITQNLRPFIKRLMSIVEGFQGLDEGVKRAIVAVGGLVAAFGPILFFLPQIITQLGLLAAAVAANPILAAAGVITAIGVALKAMKTDADNATKSIEELRESFGDLTKESREEKRADTAETINQLLAYRQLTEQFTALREQVEGEGFKRGSTGFINRLNPLLREMVANFSDTEKAAYQFGLEFFKLNDYLAPLVATEDAITDAIIEQQNQLAALTPKVVENTEVVEEQTEAYQSFGGSIQEATHAITDFSDKAGQARMTMGEFFSMLENVEVQTVKVADAANNMGNQIADAFGRAAQEAMSFGQAVAMVAREVIIAYLAQTKAKILQNSAEAAAGTGPAYPIVMAGLLAAGIGIMNRVQIPALAEGGLAYGPTTALIGDNRNARIDPEVVAPLSKLRDMMGGNQVEVFGRISGNDIFLSNARTGTSRNRYA